MMVERRERLLLGLAAGTLGAALALTAGLTDAFRSFEARTADLRLRAEAAIAGAPPDSSIVIIDIDNQSLREASETFGRWPWPRNLHAAILDFVALGRPRVVGYDVLFAEPDLTRPAADSALAVATASMRAPVVHSVVFVRPNEEPERNPAAPALADFALPFSVPSGLAAAYADAAAPIPPLLAVADGVGVIDRFPDPDGVERREPLLARIGSRAYPAFALALAVGGRRGYARLATRGEGLFLDDEPLPLENGGLRAHWRGGYSDRPYAVVAAHVVLRSYHEISIGAEPPLDPAVFSDRTVLIGSSATGVGDIVATPFGPTEPGVLLHASLFDTLVRGDFLQVPAAPLTAALVAGIALLAGLLVANARFVRSAAAGFVVILLLWSATAFALFLAAGWILPWAGPVLGAIVAYGAASAGRWLTEGRRHREIKRAFAKFLPPDVVEKIAADRGLQRRVDRRELSILFADVRGFTTLSERHGPEAIVDLLNQLFAVMIEVIFRHGGTLDKFLGDGLMAFFGAPIPQADHAARACRVAIEMQDHLGRLNAVWDARGRPTLTIGIGIHSGMTVVGFVGDVERRLEYTAIGDAVNLASRLQDYSKEAGASIVVSEETVRRAGPGFATRRLGETRVRGRVEPVVVHALESQPQSVGGESSARPTGAAALESGGVAP
jgi:adenylate cyclase